MEDCIFCNIIIGKVPCTPLYEDAETFAFLSIGPNNPGHALVIPKTHATNIYDIDDASIAAVSKTMKKLSIAVKKAMNADGINIIANNDAPAGQAVFHLHFHIIPRFKDDGYKHWQHSSYKDGEAEAVAEKIRVIL